MKKKLKLFILVYFIFTVPAAVNAQYVTTSVMINPIIPYAGGQLNVSIFIDYPNPRSVTVVPPPFDGLLTLKRSLRRSRVLENQVQTVMEYSFTVDTEERFLLESFTVNYPGGSVITEPFYINVRREIEELPVIIQRLFWENAPRQTEAGERVTLTLRANDWAAPEPPPEFFMPEVPKEAILAPSAISPEERSGGIAAKFNLIPLAAGILLFEERTLKYGNINFTVPSLRINIASSSPVNIVTQDSVNNGNNAESKPEDPLFLLNSGNKSKYRAKLPFFLLLFLIFPVIILLFVCFTLKSNRGKTYLKDNEYKQE